MLLYEINPIDNMNGVQGMNTHFKKAFSVILSLIIILSASVIIHADDEKLNYVVLGDSIAYGFGIRNSDEACYGRIVANTNGYNYSNYGINGFRTMDLKEQIKEDNIRKDITDADIISLSIGGNDYLQQNLPVLFADVITKKYKYIDDIEEIFRENFAEIIGTIKEYNPDVKILVQTLYNPRFDLLRSFYGIAVERINRSINAYLEENPDAFEVVDVYSVFTKDHPEYIAVDTVHPSAEGNYKLAELVLEKLCEAGLGTETEPVIAVKGIDQIPYLSTIIKYFRDMIAGIFAFFSTGV